MSRSPVRVPMWWLRSVEGAAQPGEPGYDETAVDTVVLDGFATAERADGSVVDRQHLPAGHAPSGARAGRVRMRTDNQQVLRVETLAEHLASAPGLVYVERIARTEDPVYVELVAFACDEIDGVVRSVRGLGGPGSQDVAEGTVVTPRDLRRLGLVARDQVGAVRWYPATGQVFEVYVRPSLRRRYIGKKLLLTAEAVAAARGWPHLRVGDVRTALGEAMLRRLRWGGAARVARLSVVAPPMTPPEDAAGLSRRYLDPDE